MAVLKSARRKKMSDSSFVFVKKRKAKRGTGTVKERRYPIHDLAHARNALARVAGHGTPSEKAKVKAAVYKRYPGLKKRAQARKKKK
jgi:hypothetical protein